MYILYFYFHFFNFYIYFMKLLKYIDFITEARGDIKCPSILSESFIKKCKKVDSPISKSLIDMDRKMSSYTFINDSLDGETVQYTESERVIDYLNKRFGTVKTFDPQKWLSVVSNPEPDSDFWTKSRVDIKVGRFVRRFLTEDFTDAQIEDFVNKWKSLKDEGESFEFWSGQKIPEAYETENYDGEEGYNPLWNSCMNNRTDLVDFYVFVRKLEVVVLLSSDNKILGRSLLWTDVEERKFLDRVYYTNDKDYYKFIKLAKDNNWYYKSKNISGGSTWLFNGEEIVIKTKIKYPKEAIQDFMFPYLDTFYYLDEEGFLSNYEPSSSHFVLNGTDGEAEYYSNVFDVHGNRVDEEDNYIFSKTQNGLVSLYSSEHVQYDGFDDYIEIKYLEDPKNGFIFDDNEQEWYKKEDYDKMKSSK